MKFSISRLLLCVSAIYTACINADEMHERTGSLHLGIEYLFWKVETDQVAYGIRSMNSNAFSNGNFAGINDFVVADQSFKPVSGARTTIGWNFSPEFDTELIWTHFKRCTTTNVPDNGFALQIPAFTGILNPSAGMSSQSQWCAKFDTIDFEVAGSSCVLEGLQVRSYMGFKWARIHQSQDISYQGVSVTDNQGIPHDVAPMIFKKDKFFGAGPRLGVDARLDFSYGFNLFSTLSTSFLYGPHGINAQYNFINYAFPSVGPAVITPSTITISDNVRRVAPMFQILAGIGKDTWICGIPFDFGIAYEVQYWWSLTRAVPSPAAVGAGVVNYYGDFATHGLTVHAGISF